jgi:hypothetical protein
MTFRVNQARKVKGDVWFRKELAEKAGLAFGLPNKWSLLPFAGS